MHVLLHGFGIFALVWRHLVAHAREAAPHIEWSIVLQTDHYLDLMREVLPDDRILCLEQSLARTGAPEPDLRLLAHYRGNIHADIEAEKLAFKHRPAGWQLARAVETYRLYKAFAQRVAPTHLLISQIEGFEGKMLAALGHELGLTVMVPTNGRNLGGTFFSPDAYETLPAHRAATPELTARAAAFVASFRERPTSAAGRLAAGAAGDDPALPLFRRGLPVRTLRFLRRAIARPDLFEREHLRTSFLNTVTPVRDAWFAWNRWRAKDLYDVGAPERLPERFVYYPLQMTPESSINTPAPYFVDQFRVIDAIRFALPHDHLLVIKEHPSSILVRPASFMKRLRRRAGVVVAEVGMDSRMLARRASATISVTGSATLEAFLFGKPSLVLGSSLIASYLGGPATIDTLRDRLAAAIAAPPAEETIVRAVAEIMSVSYDVTFGAPGLEGEPVLRRGNIARLLDAVLDHARRVAAAPAHARAA
jgi:hypothetical protein